MDTWTTNSTEVINTVGLVRSRIIIEETNLLVIDGPHKGIELALNKDIIFIGRDPWSDVPLTTDPQVSNQHCELRISEAGIVIRDLSSSNGLFLDGHRIIEAFWSPGSTLTLGATKIELRSSQNKCPVNIDYIDSTGKLVGRSQPMRKIFNMLKRLGQRRVSVLLTGETGTGKTSIAAALHEQGGHQAGPFVVVNCGALPPSLIESALFGHEKGAFTGAHKSQAGYFEQAHGGTIFLDEIGELPLEMQPKLLSVLESQSVQRLGSPKMVQTSFRLVSATHRNLLKEVESGNFREDLYYRISTVPLAVPPLRERPEDLPLLLEKLLEDLSPDEEVRFSPNALKKMQNYIWPGNIRQLRNCVEQALVFMESPRIEADEIDLPDSPASKIHPTVRDTDVGLSEAGEVTITVDGATHEPLKQTLEKVEKALLTSSLEKEAWEVAKAAVNLGISLPWLYRRMKKFGLKRP